MSNKFSTKRTNLRSGSTPNLLVVKSEQDVNNSSSWKNFLKSQQPPTRISTPAETTQVKIPSNAESHRLNLSSAKPKRFDRLLKSEHSEQTCNTQDARSSQSYTNISFLKSSHSSSSIKSVKNSEEDTIYNTTKKNVQYDLSEDKILNISSERQNFSSTSNIPVGIKQNLVEPTNLNRLLTPQYKNRKSCTLNQNIKTPTAIKVVRPQSFQPTKTNWSSANLPSKPFTAEDQLLQKQHFINSLTPKTPTLDDSFEPFIPKAVINPNKPKRFERLIKSPHQKIQSGTSDATESTHKLIETSPLIRPNSALCLEINREKTVALTKELLFGKPISKQVSNEQALSPILSPKNERCHPTIKQTLTNTDSFRAKRLSRHLTNKEFCQSHKEPPSSTNSTPYLSRYQNAVKVTSKNTALQGKPAASDYPTTANKYSRVKLPPIKPTRFIATESDRTSNSTTSLLNSNLTKITPVIRTDLPTTPFTKKRENLARSPAIKLEPISPVLLARITKSAPCVENPPINTSETAHESNICAKNTEIVKPYFGGVKNDESILIQTPPEEKFEDFVEATRECVSITSMPITLPKGPCSSATRKKRYHFNPWISRGHILNVREESRPVVKAAQNVVSASTSLSFCETEINHIIPTFEEIVRYPDVIDSPEINTFLKFKSVGLAVHHNLKKTEIAKIIQKITGRHYVPGSLLPRKYICMLLQHLYMRDPETDIIMDIDEYVRRQQHIDETDSEENDNEELES